MTFVFNPVRPQFNGKESDAYWEEVDRYTDEMWLEEKFGDFDEGGDNASTR